MSKWYLDRPQLLPSKSFPIHTDSVVKEGTKMEEIRKGKLINESKFGLNGMSCVQ
jgi:hypothetical protein